MIPIKVPVIQKTDALIFGHRTEKSADLGVTVYRHLLCHERMRKGEIRIVLTGVFLLNDQVGDKVQHKASVVSKTFS